MRATAERGTERLNQAASEQDAAERQALLDARRSLQQQAQDKIQALLDSVQLGRCNVDEDRTRCSPNNPLDAFCGTCFSRLPKEYRAELRQARDIWNRQPSGNARANAYRAYVMRIIGARLWLKKNG